MRHSVSPGMKRLSNHPPSPQTLPHPLHFLLLQLILPVLKFWASQRGILPLGGAGGVSCWSLEVSHPSRFYLQTNPVCPKKTTFTDSSISADSSPDYSTAVPSTTNSIVPILSTVLRGFPAFHPTSFLPPCCTPPPPTS